LEVGIEMGSIDSKHREEVIIIMSYMGLVLRPHRTYFEKPERKNILRTTKEAEGFTR